MRRHPNHKEAQNRGNVENSVFSVPTQVHDFVGLGHCDLLSVLQHFRLRGDDALDGARLLLHSVHRLLPERGSDCADESELFPDLQHEVRGG